MFSRDFSKLLPTFAIVALLALGLAACGGGDDSTSSTSGGDAGSTTGTEKGADSGSTGGSGAAEGSAGFRVPGGDNSIQEYGEEADSGEIEEAEEALAKYLDARAAGDWDESCDYLSKEALAPLEQLTKASPQLKGADCGEILEKLQGTIPSAGTASPLVDGLAALRVEDNRGFGLFHGPKGTDYFVLMSKEDDGWRVGALAPSEFP